MPNATFKLSDSSEAFTGTKGPLTVDILGGPWDLVTTYNWAYSPTYNPPKWPYRGYPNYK